jgi:nucleotide-binding universal stress UspA family protein
LSALPNPAELVPLMGDAYAASYAVADLESTVSRVYREAGGGAWSCDKQWSRSRRAGRTWHCRSLVRQESVDCLLLGTVARSGFAAFWLGNTAEDILPRVDL